MDQLFSAFGIDWKVLLAQSVNFGVLLVGLTYFLYKPVLKLLKERQEIIAKGVKDAEEAGKKAKEIEAEKNEVLAQAARDAESAVTKGVSQGKTERAQIIERAQAQSDSILTDARLQAEEIKRQAEIASQKEIAKTAILAAEKILAGK